MATPKAQTHQRGEVLDYTAAADKVGGDVVEIAGRCAVLTGNVSSGDQMGGKVAGIMKVEKTQVAWLAEDDIWFDADGNPYLGTASTGAAQPTQANETGDMWMGQAAYAAGANDTHGYVMLNRVGQSNGRKKGTLSYPRAWLGTNEWEELYIGCAAAASDKAVMRHRGLPTVAQTTGQLTVHLVQCYGNADGDNVFVLRAGNFEVGIKAATALLTGGTMCPLRVKVEDLGNDLTAAGTAQVNALEIAAQMSTGTTIGSGNFSLVRFQHEGNVAADQYFYFGPAGGMAREVGLLIKTAATVAQSSNFLSAGSLTDSGSADVACDARFKCDFGGTPYYIPLFDTAA